MRVEYFYYFWLALFVLFILIQLIQWIQNIRIKNRYKKFKFFNDYARFKELINPKISKKIIIFANFLIFASIAFLLTFSFIDFPVYRYYFYLLIPLALSDATIIYHEYTRKHQKLDLEEVDVAYYKIDGMITNTDRYIEERTIVIKELASYMQTTQKELAPLLGKSSSALFTSILDDLNKKKAELQGKIDNLQNNIEQLKNAFVETLNLKLRNENAPFNKIFKSTSTDATAMDATEEIGEIKRSTEAKIAQAIDSFVSMAPALPLTELKVIFQTYAKFSENIPSTSILNVLEKMNLETTEYDEFIEIFYNIPMEMGEIFKKYFIPKDIQWIYTPTFATKLLPPQKRAVYKELIHQKATRSLETILAQLDPVTLSELDELSHIVDVDPVVLAKIKRYQRITDRLYQSFNALNAPENIYLILAQRQKPLKETRDFLTAHPLDGIDVNQHAETIFSLYHQEFNRMAQEVISIVESLDAFKALNHESRSLYNWTYLEDFILENAGRLNLNYVYLGLGLFLMDLEKTNLLIRLSELPVHDQDRFKNLIQRFDTTGNLDFKRIKETGKWDKNILIHPRISGFKDRLPNIIMRVENQRMTLSSVPI